jgi:hypothetical protein
VLILIAPMVVAQLVACMPAPTLTPVPPTVTPIPAATATAPAVEKAQASAWVSHSRPSWGSVVTVFAKLTQGDQGVANAEMYCIVRDQDADRRWPSEGFEVTGEDGIAFKAAVPNSMVMGFVARVSDGSRTR